MRVRVCCQCLRPGSQLLGGGEGGVWRGVKGKGGENDLYASPPEGRNWVTGLRGYYRSYCIDLLGI